MIAFIGMGHLGANFVQAMLRQGEQVQIWNRTAEKAKALETYGAIACSELMAAVKGAKRIHLTLKDDASVNELLEAAKDAFEPGVIILDHTTTSTDGAAERTALWKSRGYTYLHAPVFMGPQNALESTGYMLVSGDQSVIAEVEPALKKMTGTLVNLGTEIDKAAGMKLLGNLFLVAFTAGIADTLAFGKGLGIGADEVMNLFAQWNPGAGMPARLKRMAGGKYDEPTWELNMARKDVGLMLAEAAKTNTTLMTIPAAAKEMDRWIEKGYGSDDWVVIGKDGVS